MTGNPKVSIISITYNQEKYIREALDGFVMQKTDFPFVAIVADDGSTDGTRKIIKEYTQEYPDIIKPLFREKNMGAWQNFTDAICSAESKYIALCEGDDYWTDPQKLQRQVDFLDKNQDYALCFHPVKVVFENNEEKDSIYPTENDARKFTTKELLKSNFIQTNSVMYRKQKYEDIATNVMPGDWYLHLYHAQFGRIGFINKVMSVYRKHPGGIWWQTSHDGDIDEIWKKHGIGHMVLYGELLKIYGDTPQYRDIIDNHIAGTVGAINRIDNKYKTKIMQTYTDGYSEHNKVLLLSLSRSIYENSKSLDKLNEDRRVAEEKFRDTSHKYETLEHEKETLEHEKETLEHEKETILNSRVYKSGILITAPYRITRKLLKGADKNE